MGLEILVRIGEAGLKEESIMVEYVIFMIKWFAAIGLIASAIAIIATIIKLIIYVWSEL